MTGAEAIEIMRTRLNDEAGRVYSDAELLAYLNTTITAAANEMNRAGLSDLVKTVTIPSGGTLEIPGDFSFLLPGMPCTARENMFMADPFVFGMLDISYFSIPGPVALDEVIPISPVWCMKAANWAVEMAGLRTAHDTTLDSQLHKSLAGGGGNA